MTSPRCVWCQKPILKDESFVCYPGGVYLHTNNAAPSCQAQYSAAHDPRRTP